MTRWCPCQQRPSDYGIPMDVEMAYVQDSFLTNDILHEMVSSLLGGMGAPCGGWVARKAPSGAYWTGWDSESDG